MARTKNRSAAQRAPALPTRRWRLGAYVRLSREDLNRGPDDSNSVSHQRALLEDYCRRHPDEFESAETYVDDGCTGTDMIREGFQRLLADVCAKRVDCVMVKDLSRLSRNYAEAGTLIENLFVRLNVRFISLAEGIDSYRNPDSASSLLVPITNVMNDNFCYQTSQKIRQVFDMKRRSGQFIGGFTPYGYAKNPRDKHAFVIDGEAAQVVRSIYAWYLEGMSKNAIVRRLNSRGILCPSAYKKSRGLRYENPHAAPGSLWSAKTVGDILKNQVYAGDMVQGRQRVKSYKIHTQEPVPQSQWYIVPHTHAPIIQRPVFEKVQALLARDTRTAPGQGTPYLFSGFLRCADCGKAMSRSRVKDAVYYFCRTYKDQSKTACTRHAMRHEGLEAAVLSAVRQQVFLSVHGPHVLARVAAAPPGQSPAARLDALMAEGENGRAKILRYRQSAYEDWKDGVITSADYERMSADYQRQLTAMDETLADLAAQRAQLTDSVAQSPYLTALRERGTVDGLTRELLIELVDRILVHEGGCITIYFKLAPPI